MKVAKNEGDARFAFLHLMMLVGVARWSVGTYLLASVRHLFWRSSVGCHRVKQLSLPFAS